MSFYQDNLVFEQELPIKYIRIQYFIRNVKFNYYIADCISKNITCTFKICKIVIYNPMIVIILIEKHTRIYNIFR